MHLILGSLKGISISWSILWDLLKEDVGQLGEFWDISCILGLFLARHWHIEGDFEAQATIWGHYEVNMIYGDFFGG